MAPFYGWFVVCLSGLLYLASALGHTTGVNMAIPHFVADLGVSRTEISLIWVAALLVSAVGLPFAGSVVDKYGPQRVTQAVWAPYAVAVAGLGAVHGPVTLALCLIVVRFLGPECLLLVANTTPNKWFVRRRGHVAAALALVDAAMLAFAPLFQALINTFGWRRAYFVLAGCVAVLGLVCAVFLRDDPVDCGLLPDGDEPAHESPHSDANVAAGAGKVADDASALGDESVTFRQVLCKGSFWSVAMSAGAMNLFWSGFNYHSVFIMRKVGLTADETATYVFVTLAVATGVSAFTTGLTMDRFSTTCKLCTLCAAYLAISVSMLFLLSVQTRVGAAVFAAVYGLAVGAYQSLQMPMYANLFGTRHLGKVQGLGVAVGIASSSVGPLLFGISADRTGSYRTAILACAGLTTITCLSLPVVALRLARDRRYEAIEMTEQELEEGKDTAIVDDQLELSMQKDAFELGSASLDAD